MTTETLTKFGAAGTLGLSTETVERWTAAGRLLSVLEGGRRLYPISDLENLVRRSRVGGDDLVNEVTANPLLRKSEVAAKLRTSIQFVVEFSRRHELLPRIEFSPVLIRYSAEDLSSYILDCRDFTEPVEESSLATAISAAVGTRLKPGRQLLTVTEAGRMLGMGESQVRVLANRGEIGWIRLKPSRLVRFDLAEVQALVESRRQSRWPALTGGVA